VDSTLRPLLLGRTGAVTNVQRTTLSSRKYLCRVQKKKKVGGRDKNFLSLSVKGNN
jgi:hypothetical protein